MGDRDLTHLQSDFARKVAATVSESKGAGWTVLVTDGERTFQEQADIYAQHRDQATVDAALAPLGLKATARPDLPKVTDAKPGDSFHNVRRAVDYCLIVNGRASYDATGLKAVAEIAEGHGLEWGGRWASLHDDDHLQYAWCEKCQERHPSAQYFDADGNCKA